MIRSPLIHLIWWSLVLCSSPARSSGGGTSALFADLKVRGKGLSPARGRGGVFTERQRAAYEKIYHQVMDGRVDSLQWHLMELEEGQVLSASPGAADLFYGASVSKVFTAAAYLHQREGHPGKGGLQDLADMLVVSSNRSWRRLQVALGEGSNAAGQAEQLHIVRDLPGMEKTIPYRGWYAGVHGNKISAEEMNLFMQHLHQGALTGSGQILTLMGACRTLGRRALRWLPATLQVAGKSGTYHGYTHSGRTGKPYRAAVRHFTLTFSHGGRTFALTVLSDGRSDRELAVLTGGLFREFVQET